MTEKNHSDQAMLSLQEELNQMAGEVPEMPESFRLGWREAVRKAAAEASETSRAAAAEPSEAQEKEPVPFPAAAFQAAAKPAAQSRGRVLPLVWSRSLSIAALFVFLLGGALLGQDAAHFVQTPEPMAVAARKADGSVAATSALSPLSTPVVLNSAPELTLQESAAAGSISADVASLPDAAQLTPEAAGFRADSLPKSADAAIPLQSEEMEAEAFAAEEAVEDAVEEAYALSAESVSSAAEEAPEAEAAEEAAADESSDAGAGKPAAEREESIAEAAAPEAESSTAEAGSVRQGTPLLRILGICLIVLALLLILPVLWFRKKK